jgi:hypothetical protein
VKVTDIVDVTTPIVTTTSEERSAIFFLFLGRKATMSTVEPHNLMTNHAHRPGNKQKKINALAQRETGRNMRKSKDRKDYPPDTDTITHIS